MSNYTIRIEVNDDTPKGQVDGLATVIAAVLKELGITAVVFVAEEEVEDVSQAEAA